MSYELVISIDLFLNLNLNFKSLLFSSILLLFFNPKIKSKDVENGIRHAIISKV